MYEQKKERNLDIKKSKEQMIAKIRTILQFQFGQDIFSDIFSDPTNINLKFSKKTGKIKQLMYKRKIFMSYKPHVGRFSLSLEAAVKLHEETESPAFRVVINHEIQDYIKMGKSAFAKHVLSIDPNLRPGDDALIVNENDEFLAIGKLLVPSLLYPGSPTGIAVDTRKGINKLKR